MATDVQTIKDKIDIVDLIGEYTQLKSAGINHKACCPFHQEKTPSFMVNRERQSFKCFGCGKGGDIFTFVQEIEGMEFVEALRYLANKAGVPIETYKSEINTSQKNRIKDINTEAARFFHNFLIKIPASKKALEYLNERGLTRDTIEEWQIGFVPEQWDLLTQYLLKKGHSIDDLVTSGLTIKRDGANAQSGRGFYDRFRGRIMFPIWDLHGSVVGFTGRVLVETEKSGGKPVSNKFTPGKYVNTPQTIVYDKSRVVYGLNKSKREIRSKDLIVMVEGQMDVIACHQAGMKNVVASSGTALTEMQITLLKRYSKNMNMAFDADDAGQNAAKRGIDIALQKGMSLKVIRIPEGKGKDPDECLKQNKEVWFSAVENAQEVMQWYFDKIFTGKDLNNFKDKQKIADELLPEINRIQYAVERDHWLRELGNKIGVDVSVLREDMKRIKSKIQNPKSKINQQKDDEVQVIKKEKTRLDLLVERYMVLLVKYFKLIKSDDLFVSEDHLSTTEYFALYKAIKYQYTEDNQLNLDKLREQAEDQNLKNQIDTLVMQGDLEVFAIPDSSFEKEIEKLMRDIKKEFVNNRKKVLQREIEVAEKESNKIKLDELMKEFSQLYS